METNQDLLVQLKKGNERAFRQLFDLYFKAVYFFIYKHVKNKEEAEDITQNLFIKIWNKRETVDTSRSFEGFLFTIAFRMVIDHLRQHALRPGGKLNIDAQEAAFVSTLTAEDSLNQHTLASNYQKALDTLPAKRKEIFMLSRHEGLSNKAIAEKLDISIKTVENQMTAALSSLKGHFRNEEMGFFFLAMMAIS